MLVVHYCVCVFLYVHVLGMCVCFRVDCGQSSVPACVPACVPAGGVRGGTLADIPT